MPTLPPSPRNQYTALNSHKTGRSYKPGPGAAGDLTPILHSGQAAYLPAHLLETKDALTFPAWYLSAWKLNRMGERYHANTTAEAFTNNGAFPEGHHKLSPP